ncbi:MAG TPA: hypothetical protein VG866_02150 [Candidatus Paceibacterota bacterium]|nr:hypothetical protein [Candidatus Paceibacterota bacterium]
MLILRRRAARAEFAQLLRIQRKEILSLLAKHPLEIIYGDEINGTYFRVVLDKLREVDLLIKQLESETVSKEEALNPTLVC